MTRYADELKGSEGENIVVLSAYNPYRVGSIIEADDDGATVTVQYDDGSTERVGYGRVQLVDDEDVFQARKR